jgi:HPr kinase/phosphorylase
LKNLLPKRVPSEIPSLTVRALLTPEAGSLKLQLVAGRKGLDRAIESPRVERLYQALSSAVDDLPRGNVQLIDNKSLATLDALPAAERLQILERLGRGPAAFIILEDHSIPSYLVKMARRCRAPLLRTPLTGSVVSRRVRRFIDKMLVRRKIVHGVLVDIYGLGTLIVGESGIGKSESALELIERGHRLVSDDIIEIYRGADKRAPGQTGDALMGRSPSLTRYFMELRGLGVINVKDLFGPNSIRMSKSVDLVIRLERWEKATEIERLGLEEESFEILGGSLPLVRMPVGPGRNLAMLIEVAARNHLLKQAGQHPARRLMKKVSALAHRRGRH